MIRLSAWRKNAPAPRPPEMAAVTGAKRASWQRAAPAKPGVLPTAEFISKEVDPILDKISAHGIHSLTEREPPHPGGRSRPDEQAVTGVGRQRSEATPGLEFGPSPLHSLP